MARKAKALPSAEMKKKEKPVLGIPENILTICGTQIEIKPTKLKYERNRTAAFYRMMDMYPLADILAMDTVIAGDDRDGDKCVMDWLIAVFDDEQFVLDHYDDMTVEDIEKALAIFRRINKIDEKEQKRKNLMTDKTTA